MLFHQLYVLCIDGVIIGIASMYTRDFTIALSVNQIYCHSSLFVRKFLSLICSKIYIFTD